MLAELQITSEFVFLGKSGRTNSLGSIQVGRDDIGNKYRPDRGFCWSIRADTFGFHVCASAEPLAGRCGQGIKMKY